MREVLELLAYISLIHFVGMPLQNCFHFLCQAYPGVPQQAAVLGRQDNVGSFYFKQDNEFLDCVKRGILSARRFDWFREVKRTLSARAVKINSGGITYKS